MKPIFFISVFTFLLLLTFFATFRGWQVLQPFPNIRLGYLITNIVLFGILLSNFLLRNALPDNIAKVLAFVGFSYLIFVIYILLSFLVSDIAYLLNLLFHFAPPGMKAFRFGVFVTSFVVIIISMLVGNYKFNHPEIIRLNLQSSKPLQGKTLRIVAASDIHLGVSIDKKKLQEYVALINAEKPDIVLLVGDIADHSTIPVVEQNMAEEFRAIQSKYGVFAISGNHEYFGEDPHGLEKYLKTAGVTYLRDSSVLIDSSFYVVGRDDKINTKRKELTEIVQGIDKSKAMILLDHQPFHLNEAVENHFDLQLSGHTHNGQFFPGNLIVKRMYEVAHGYFQKGSTHFYISSGLGIWGPQYRIGTQSELVVVELSY